LPYKKCVKLYVKDKQCGGIMLKRSFAIGALTDIGNVKKTNEDNILVKVGDEKNGEFGLFLVADGMGGLAAERWQAGLL